MLSKFKTPLGGRKNDAMKGIFQVKETIGKTATKPGLISLQIPEMAENQLTS